MEVILLPHSYLIFFTLYIQGSFLLGATLSIGKVGSSQNAGGKKTTIALQILLQ